MESMKSDSSYKPSKAKLDKQKYIKYNAGLQKLPDSFWLLLTSVDLNKYS